MKRGVSCWALSIIVLFLFAGIAKTNLLAIFSKPTSSIPVVQGRLKNATITQSHEALPPPKQYFNCSYPDALCHWLRPSEIHLNDRRLCTNLAYPRYQTLSWDDDCSADNLSSYTNITYFKVLKAGSTSMTHALHSLQTKLEKGGCRISMESRPLIDRSGEVASGHLEAIARDQHDTSLNIVVIAVLRDPVERFLSALGQALLMKDTAEKLHSQCGKLVSDKSRLVKCTLNLLDTSTRSYAEVEAHLCPQAAQLQTEANLRVAVFDMADFSLLLQHLVPEFSSHHARDRSNVAYSHSQTLSSLRAEDLSLELIREICQLYQVDVTLRRSIGMTNVWCDS